MRIHLRVASATLKRNRLTFEAIEAAGCRTIVTKTASSQTVAISSMYQTWNGVFSPQRRFPWRRARRSKNPP